MTKANKATGKVASPAVPVVLVTVERSHPVTTSERIATAAGIQHKNVLALVREHIADFQEFGRVAFETRTFATAGGEQSREVAVLNEPQSTLLFTFLRNTKIVRAVKVRLVREFFRVTAELAKLKAMRSAPDWKPARIAAATDFSNVVEMLRECRGADGKTTERHHFINEAKLMRFAFSGDGKTKWDRDNLTAADLKTLAKVERLNLRLIARDVPYADRKAQCRALWMRETGFILKGAA